MCYMFYIVSDRKLPIVDQDPQYPNLTIREARKDVSRAIRRVAKGSNIYYVGSWQGCGCGFFYEDHNELEATLSQIPDENIRNNGLADWQAGYNSVVSLGRYLADAVTFGSLYLYIAWAGHEGKPIKVHATTTPAYFGGQSFTTPEEDSLLTIVSA